MRLRRKITIAFFLVSSLVSVLLALFLYRFIGHQLEAELRTKLLDMAHIGAAEVEMDAYQRLHDQLGGTDEVRVAAVESSEDYKAISDHLRMLRRAEPELMQYAYLLAPTDDANNPQFVVDADVLDFNARLARGEKLPEGESVSHFALPYDISAIPVMKKALTECSTQLENDFVWDEKFKVNSVSAYVPLTDEDGKPLRDELFSTFDKLAEKHGLEKIKTIGDAYMVVAGIPQPVANHAHAIAHMAIDMLHAVDDFAKREKSELTIRIGIHTGPVVAGVIGQKKFIYDLWGDTVNTASRMESHGVPARIHVTATTYQLLRDTFELEPRDPIEIKGKGRMQTYLVIGKRATMKTLEPRPSDPSGWGTSTDGG